MGQRSQIYVIYKDNQNRDCISATYFQWNYGERMISRARYLMGWLKSQDSFYAIDSYNLFSLSYVANKIRYIASVNFDYKDVVIGQDLIEEWKDYKQGVPNANLNDYIFNVDNNDGCLFIDARIPKNLKYAFTTYEYKDGVMGPEAYLKWDKTPQKIQDTKFTKRNINWIIHNAKLMKKKELEAILRTTYYVS